MVLAVREEEWVPKNLSSRTETSWKVKRGQTWRKAAGRGKREQERDGEARCARVNRENWVRTKWDGHAENRTRRKGE